MGVLQGQGMCWGTGQRVALPALLQQPRAAAQGSTALCGAVLEPQQSEGAGQRSPGKPTAARVDADPGARRSPRAHTEPSCLHSTVLCPSLGCRKPGREGRETWSCSQLTSPVPPGPVPATSYATLTYCPLPSLPELLGSAKKVNVNFQDTDG